MSSATYRDDPWRRLPWLVPAAGLLALLSLMGFLALLSGPAYRPTPPAPVEAELVEIPAPAAPVAAPPPPPVVAPEPPPPEPAAEAAPEPPPPPKPAPPRPRPERPPPQRQAVAAPPPATPMPSAPSADTAPGGDQMGARAIYRPLPEVPEELRRRALSLVAVARFRIAADGTAEAELIEPTPDPTLNRALLETLGKWRFFPAMAAGKPIASTIDIRIPITVK